MGEEKSESRGTNYGGTGFTTHRTQNEAVGGNICCHAYPCGRSQPTGHQLWGEREPGEGGGDCQQELRAAEFPWTCLILNQNNDFLGTCALVPQSFNNDLGRGTRKILTAAHNLKKIGPNDRVKVRVGEYDASGFNPPETRSHIEYTVSKIVRHPQFDAKRLSDDIAVMITPRVVDLQHPYVSPACFPSCQEQFDHVFSNGTGARCWTAGWGKMSSLDRSNSSSTRWTCLWCPPRSATQP